MAITNQQTSVSFTGNGLAKEFALPFPVLEAGHVKLSGVDDQGGIVVWYLGTSYTVRIDKDAEGFARVATVVLTAPLPAGWTLTVLRDVPATQETRMANQGGYYPQSTEIALDKLTMICQQLQAVVDRAMVAPEGMTPEEALDALVNAAAGIAALQEKNDQQDAAINQLDGNTVKTGDPRLGDARTPTAHASSHGTAGSDKITPASIGAVATGDARLVDARTPKTHAASHATGGSDPIALPVASSVQRGLAKGDETTIRTNNDGTLTALSSGGGGMPLAPSNGGPYGAVGAEWFEIAGGGGGTLDHGQLTAASRMKPNQHPIEAITDLSETLASIINDLTAKANLASPTFSGTPKAPTPAATDNSTNIATTAFVKAQNYAPTETPILNSPIIRNGVNIQTGAVTIQTAASLAVLGTSTFTQSPTVPTPTKGDSSTKVATTEFVQQNAGAPIVGQIIMFANASTPSKWLLCQGQAISRTTYSALYNAVGIAYGSGDGSTTFNLPDFCSRVPLGYGQGDGLTYRTIGSKGGAETHTLTLAELGAHSHGSADGYGFLTANTSGAYCASGSGRGASTAIRANGGDQAHNNMQPWLAVNFIIYAGV